MSKLSFTEFLVYNSLKEWKARTDGKTELVYRGFKRRGKPSVVKQFAENEYEICLWIDFYESTRDVRDIFEDLSDLDYIILQLQFAYHTSFKEGKTIIVFDNVQLCPKAQDAARLLATQGKIDFIVMGT